MPFRESLKLKVKKKADFRCCMCQGLVNDVHHIIPEKDGDPNTIDNAAPLCAGDHRTYGNNPDFRKTIIQMRDYWYETCELKRNALQRYDETIFEKVDEIQREMKGGFAEVRYALANFYKGKLHEIESAATPDGLSEAISAIASGTSVTPIFEIAAKESRPFLSRLFINLPTTKEVGVWIENRGKGIAHLTPYDIVINGDIKSKHNIRTLADWQTVLKRLGINHPWVEMTAIRRQMTIEPGGSILVLRMKPSEFSKERYQQFIEAIDGMEFLLSYKSSTGKEFIFSFDDLNFLP